jgi:hypothetical protein
LDAIASSSHKEPTMTTLDNSKLHRILTMADCYTVELASSKVFMQAAQALWHAAQVEQKEADARICGAIALPDSADNRFAVAIRYS